MELGKSVKMRSAFGAVIQPLVQETVVLRLRELATTTPVSVSLEGSTHQACLQDPPEQKAVKPRPRLKMGRSSVWRQIILDLLQGEPREAGWSSKGESSSAKRKE